MEIDIEKELKKRIKLGLVCGVAMMFWDMLKAGVFERDCKICGNPISKCTGEFA